MLTAMSRKSESAPPGFWRSIQGDLILLLLILLIPAILIRIYIHRQQLQTRVSEELQANLEVARATARNFESFVRDIVHSELIVGLALTASPSLSEADRRRLVEKFNADNPALRSLHWINPDGQVIEPGPEDMIGVNVSDRPFFREIRSGREWVVSEAFSGKVTGQELFVICRAIRSEQGELAGIVAAAILPANLDRIIAIKRYQDAGVSLIDSRGMHAYRFPATNYTPEQRNWLKHYPVIGEALAGNDLATVVTSALTGKQRLVAFVPIEGTGWVASASRAQEDAMAVITSDLKRHNLLFAGFILVAFGVALFFSRYIAAPIKRLRDQVLRLGAGETCNPKVDTGPTELIELASAFYLMSERIKAREGELGKSEEKFRILFHALPEPLALAVGDDATVLDVNDACCRFLGLSRAEIEERPFMNLDIWHDLEERHQIEKLLAAGTEVMDGGCHLRTQAGAVKTILLSTAKVETRTQQGRLFILKDITAHKAAEKALRDQNAELQTIFDAVPALIFYKDSENRLMRANQLWFEAFGLNEAAVIGKSLHEFLPKEEAERFYRDDLEVIAADRAKKEILEEFQIDGKTLWFKTQKIPYRDDAGRVTGIIGFAENITSRKQAEEELRESRQRLSDIIDFLPDATFVIGEEGTVIAWNRAIEEMTGVKASDMLGRGNYEYALPFYGERRPILIDLVLNSEGEVAAGYERMARGESILEAEAPVPGLKGKMACLYGKASVLRNSKGKIVGAIESIRDITERKRAEKEKETLELQLRQVHKTEAIGTLAGGIAHDFNNILGIIMGYAELARMELSGATTVRENLDEVLRATHRAKGLVRQILDFSRTHEHERKPLRLVPVVKEVLKLLRASLPSSIEMDQALELPTGEDLVLADPTQIHQLLMNLATNAAHAMRGREGRLRVALSPVFFDVLDPNRPVELSPGKHLDLTVEDTGHGMDKTTIQRIFDPYFTTKGPGEGTGLGLAVVHGIVKNHGGAIRVFSEPDQGTVFHVYIPALESVEPVETEPSPALPGGSERILLVDDEEALAKALQKMLETLGYQVTAVTGSREALEIFRGQPEAFDLVITDYTMPKMTGADLAREILKIRSNLPIILSTGFSERLDEEGAAAGISALIMKPVSLRGIAELIWRVRKNREGDFLSQ